MRLQNREAPQTQLAGLAPDAVSGRLRGSPGCRSGVSGVVARAPVTFTVYGLPAPQGSKRAFVLKGTGRAVMVESSKAVKPWRQAVEQAVMLAEPFGGRLEGPILCRGPVFLDVTFTMPRPKSAKKGARPCTRPDLDKLLRSTKDALKTAGVYEDDGRVVSLIAAKVYPNEGEDSLAVPGAVIRVECV